MYFDAVLDSEMLPLFNGTPAETWAWLKEQTPERLEKLTVCQGQTTKFIPASEYLDNLLFFKILSLVKAGLLDQDIATDRKESAGMVTRANVLTRKIVEALG